MLRSSLGFSRTSPGNFNSGWLAHRPPASQALAETSRVARIDAVMHGIGGSSIIILIPTTRAAVYTKPGLKAPVGQVGDRRTREHFFQFAFPAGDGRHRKAGQPQARNAARRQCVGAELAHGRTGQLATTAARRGRQPGKASPKGSERPPHRASPRFAVGTPARTLRQGDSMQA
jgi:hypothetical protein